MADLVSRVIGACIDVHTTPIHKLPGNVSVAEDML